MPSLQWVPFTQRPAATLAIMALPVLTLGTATAAMIHRMARFSKLDVIGREYVRTARAKGVSEPRVTFHHALRNALIPVVTVAGVQLGYIVGGIVVFFSSRRRHTICLSDWSSDVCSSDLTIIRMRVETTSACQLAINCLRAWERPPSCMLGFDEGVQPEGKHARWGALPVITSSLSRRSEERRVGKEGSTRCAQ